MFATSKGVNVNISSPDVLGGWKLETNVGTVDSYVVDVIDDVVKIASVEVLSSLVVVCSSCLTVVDDDDDDEDDCVNSPSTKVVELTVEDLNTSDVPSFELGVLSVLVIDPPIVVSVLAKLDISLLISLSMSLVECCAVDDSIVLALLLSCSSIAVDVKTVDDCVP